MAPSALPIRTQAPEHELHETADQVGIMAIGQDTQTRVVDYQSQPLAPLLLSPTDKLIPRFEVKSGSAPGWPRPAIGLSKGPRNAVARPPVARCASNGDREESDHISGGPWAEPAA